MRLELAAVVGLSLVSLAIAEDFLLPLSFIPPISY